MGIFRKLAVLGAFALLLPNAAAFAADMPEAPFVPGPKAGTPVEFTSGWYLRGDVGYKIWHAPSLTFFNDAGPVVPYDNESLANTWVAGFGFGYQFNQRFRADITADYEGAAAFGATVPCAGGACGFTTEAAHVSAWTILANAYVDFPLMGEGPGNITPYVGAGIGFADVNWANYTSTCAGLCGSSVSDYGSTSQWRFAWALTAGASFHLTNKLLLDANYRFLDIANGLAVASTASGGAPSFGHSTYKDLYAHEFRIGLRYLIN
jgi:opacity protein-like surface antigen